MRERDLIEEHCAHLRRLNRRPGTIRARRWALERLVRGIAPVELADATVDDLRAYLDPSWSTEYQANQIIHATGFYRWALREDLLDHDPTIRLERPKRRLGLPRPMPDDHVTFALTQAPEPMRSWFYLAAYAGLRACEIGPLRGEDIHGEIILIREQKGGDTGTVPLSPVLRPVLARHPHRGWLFPHRGPGPEGPTSAGQVQRHANRWLHDNDIPETLHQLRHWFGTQVYWASGGDLRLTQELLRHKSLQTTTGYTALRPDAGAVVVAKLPAIAA